MSKTKPKIIILPGNGGTDINKHHWYAWLRNELVDRGFNVIAENMPDPDIARKSIWLPHIKNEFKADQNTILIGHSSGGVAALRYLEENKLLGAIVLGVNHTDLGYEEEKQSGYYDSPWQWEKIKTNAQWIVQLCSQDDPYIPIEEPRFIHQMLASEYHEYTDRGHFGSEYKNTTEVPELLEILNTHL
jgi:predicted alpha/beta hydrolase family esterase